MRALRRGCVRRNTTWHEKYARVKGLPFWRLFKVFALFKGALANSLFRIRAYIWAPSDGVYSVQKNLLHEGIIPFLGQSLFDRC